MNALNGTSTLRIKPFEGGASSLGNLSTAVLHLSTEPPFHIGFVGCLHAILKSEFLSILITQIRLYKEFEWRRIKE